MANHCSYLANISLWKWRSLRYKCGNCPAVQKKKPKTEKDNRSFCLSKILWQCLARPCHNLSLDLTHHPVIQSPNPLITHSSTYPCPPKKDTHSVAGEVVGDINYHSQVERSGLACRLQHFWHRSRDPLLTAGFFMASVATVVAKINEIFSFRCHCARPARHSSQVGIVKLGRRGNNCYYTIRLSGIYFAYVLAYGYWPNVRQNR